MKYLFALILFYSNSLYAQTDNFIQDFPVSFASTELQLTYLEAGTKTPIEGYLLTVSDLALIKLIVDDSEASCASLLQEVKDQCTRDLTACQKASTHRFQNLVSDKERLTLKNSLLQTKLEDQKTSFILYTAAGVTTSIILTVLVINIAS